MKQRLRIDGALVEYTLRRSGDGWVLEVDGRRIDIEAVERDGAELRLLIDGKLWRFDCARVGARRQFTDGEVYHTVEHAPSGEQDAGPAHGDVLSHMPGKVLAVLVSEGEAVEQGRPLVILEAMKMEHTLSAPADGVVLSLPREAGQRVMPGDLLVELELDA